MNSNTLFLGRSRAAASPQPARALCRAFRTSAGLALALLLPAAALPARAATVAWSGASGTDTNWSNGANWVGSVAPGVGDDVKLFDSGTNLSIGVPNSLVDMSFSGTIGSLQLGQTNGYHTILITNGTTLNITGGSGLVVGTPGDVAAVRNLTNTITGVGAALNINNAGAAIALSQGSATSLSGLRANLDLSGLDTFTANISRLGLGTTVLPNPGSANQREAGALFLAKTNTITLNYSIPLANYQTAGTTNALEMSRNPGNNAGILSLLYLGQTNAIFLDSLGIGRDKASASSGAWLGFNPVFTNNNPAAYFRGISGDPSRVTWWGIGDMNANASSAQVSVGTNDFSNGIVDAKANVMSLARDCSPSHTATANIVGVLTFTAGTIDVNTLLVGNQALGPSTSTAPCKGFVNVNGPAATLVVNSNLVLGSTVQAASTAAQNTSGTLNIRNGTVRANTISVGAASTVNTISMTNGTLVISNTLATAARALTVFNMTNSTLQLKVGGVSPIVVVSNLFTGGAGNIIKTPSVAVFATYPAQVPLIKYYTNSIGGAGYDFALDAGSLPASAPGAYLSNNVANQSIDLYLPNDPRPIITQSPVGFSGFPSNDLNFTVAVSPASATPLSYQWYLNVTNLLIDGSTVNGSVLAGSSTPSLWITNAQIPDSGNYTCVVTNLYGSATSGVAVVAIATNDIAPAIVSVAPGTNQTVIQGNNASFTLSVQAAPAPDYYWYDNNNNPIASATTATLALNNVQYSQLGTYSVVVSNRAGTAATNLFLNVIVAPSISAQPQPLAVSVGGTASFSVTAGGVPVPGYQWLKNNSPISGNASALTSTLTINNVSALDIANYSVVITNAAGSMTSSNAALIVHSATMAATALSPANGATSICYDTPLRITFNQAPALRSAGKIQIYNVTNAVTPVDTLDMSLNLTLNGTYAVNVQSRTIGGDAFNSFPVIITGTTAALYPHSGVMTSNQTYYVTVDDGLFTDSAGAYFAGISDTNAWRFSTRPGGPANPTNLVVAADGTGDFLTVQGAVDSVPLNNITPTLINIRNGIYTEILDVKSKNNITLRGQSRAGTMVGYPNNNNVNPSGAPLRSMIVLNGNDCAVENLTITNTTPKGGSQAEAIDIEGTRFVFYNMELDSYQDTFLVHSAGKLVYFQDCLVQGDTDFNWGYGTVFYTNCEIRCLSTGSHVTQPRSPLGSNGFSFVNCQITKGGSSVTSADLGRSISTPTTPSEVIFVRCLMDDVITGYSSDAGSNFWYASCSNLTATVEKTSLTFATHLAANDPTVLLAQDATNWLYGWVPQMAPNLLTNPVGQSVAGGAVLSLNAYATGIPSPAYQWLKNGEPMPGQTASALTIPSANVNDAGSYSVIVSNAAGVITSTAVTVTVGNTAPTLAAIADQTVNVGAIVNVNPVATDPDVPPQTLTFSLTSAPPAGSTFDTTTGAFNWRPNVSQAGATYPVSIVVTDNGTPILSATQSFNVIVNPLTQPNLTAPLWNGSQFSLTVNGQTGPDYIVMVSTNLVDWTSVFTNSSPVMPFSWTDPNSGLFPVRFYRIQPGPLP